MAESIRAGVGLKPEHFEAARAAREPGLWLEVHPENYAMAGGPRLAALEAVRARHGLSLHGVSLSLAGEAPPDAAALQWLACLVRRFEPLCVSEHLAWSRVGGHYLPDLLPFARTSRALARTARHVAQVQEAIGRPIAIENPSHYLPLAGHEWDEIDFLDALVRRSGCRLLLDVNNVLVSAHNLGFDAAAWLDRFPAQHVAEIHLAGHSRDPALGERLLVDSHDAPVAPEVWALYRRFLDRAGARPTLVERDANIPSWPELLREARQARALMDDALAQRCGELAA
ncbi:DUF692 domain-containing protein [Ramlibacter rhizophilus]|uniref:DUF692 domain-containing protein n=1 Tax=Ramlibacter rhizophilus TaxID=1781167 RepID=A0A4Z0BZ32_9BURK|nr:DUF692 domain-containing protein [Ramlibacter rhizophilus]TFZ03275.1 DUF692 domain-containing protein [Ramlibacter rhizophilus]